MQGVVAEARQGVGVCVTLVELKQEAGVHASLGALLGRFLHAADVITTLLPRPHSMGPAPLGVP